MAELLVEKKCPKLHRNDHYEVWAELAVKTDLKTTSVLPLPFKDAWRGSKEKMPKLHRNLHRNDHDDFKMAEVVVKKDAKTVP